MKLFVKRNLRDLLTILCAAALSTTTFANPTAFTSDKQNSIEFSPAMLDLGASLNQTIAITLTENDLRDIQSVAKGTGRDYVKMGSTELCLASNDKNGINIKATVVAMTTTEVDGGGAPAYADTAHVLLSIFSGVPGIKDATDVGGSKVVFASSEAIPTAGFSLKKNNGSNFLTPYGGSLSLQDLTASTSDIAFSSSGNVPASFKPLKHYGVKDGSAPPHAGSDESVKVNNCTESKVKFDLFIKADDAIGLRAGTYQTTVTIDADNADNV